MTTSLLLFCASSCPYWLCPLNGKPFTPILSISSEVKCGLQQCFSTYGSCWFRIRFLCPSPNITWGCNSLSYCNTTEQWNKLRCLVSLCVDTERTAHKAEFYNVVWLLAQRNVKGPNNIHPDYKGLWIRLIEHKLESYGIYSKLLWTRQRDQFLVT